MSNYEEKLSEAVRISFEKSIENYVIQLKRELEENPDLYKESYERGLKRLRE